MKRNFTIATLSTGGEAQATAKSHIEKHVADQLRDARSRHERRELAAMLRILDYEVRDACGRLVEIAMRDLLAQMELITASLLPTCGAFVDGCAFPDARRAAAMPYSGTPAPPPLTAILSKVHQSKLLQGGTRRGMSDDRR